MFCHFLFVGFLNFLFFWGRGKKEKKEKGRKGHLNFLLWIGTWELKEMKTIFPEVFFFLWTKELPLKKSDIQLCLQVTESYDIIFQQHERDLQSLLHCLQDRIIQNISKKAIDCKSTFSSHLPAFLILKTCTIMVKYKELKKTAKVTQSPKHLTKEKLFEKYHKRLQLFKG